MTRNSTIRNAEKLLSKTVIPTEETELIRQLIAHIGQLERRWDFDRHAWMNRIDVAIDSLETIRRQISDTATRPRVPKRIADVIEASHHPDHPAARAIRRDRS